MWRGSVPYRHIDWPWASEYLDRRDAEVAEAVDAASSPYRSRFLQGATVVPRVLTIVERVDAGPLGVVAGRLAVRSARSSNEKKPWKKLKSLEGVVEEQFVRPLLNGSSMVAFRERKPELAVIPTIDGELIDGDDERMDEFPGLAAWWRNAESLWDRNKSENSRFTLLGRLNFQRLLARQFPLPRHRVVYPASGQYLAACRITDPRAVVEHALYWAPVVCEDEGRYLCAILNSQSLAEAVAPLQSRGQHNPRHFDTHVFALAFPDFDEADELHARLARLAERAESVAAAIDLDAAWQFTKARRVVREALREEGVATEIDIAVAELITERASVPDLLAALSSEKTPTPARRRPPGRGTPVAPARANPST